MTRTRGVLIGIAIVVGGCSSTSSMKEMEVHTRKAPGAKIPDGGAYSWMFRPDDVPEDQRIDKSTATLRMRELIENELARKGYEQMGLGFKVDFLVAYRFAFEEAITAQEVNKRHGYAADDAGADLAQRFEKGSLIIDIVSPETKKLMWRGIAEAEIVVAVSDEERLRRSREAVRRILAEFPPK